MQEDCVTTALECLQVRKKDGFIGAKAKMQRECLGGCVLFARTEGILPAPESTYAIVGALDEARKADPEGVSKTILFNLSGHGHFDISAYERYFGNKKFGSFGQAI